MEVLSNQVVKKIQFIEEGILEIEFFENCTLDLDNIQHTYSLMKELTGDQKHKKLIITGKHTQITKDARIYGMEEAKRISKYVIAEAIVVHSLYQKMVINFYNQFIKNNIHVKLFTSKEEAYNWLKEHN